jgi:hypothetical protein
MSDPVIPGDPDVPDPSDTPAHPAIFDALLAEIPGKLDDDTRATYRSLADDAKALREGADVESSVVLRDLLRVVRAAQPHVIAGKVAGYGPLRLRYVVETGRALSQMLTDLDQARIDAAGKSEAREDSLDSTRTLRRRALRALKNLAGARPEEAARVRKAARTHSSQPDERSRSLQAIADELEALAGKVSAQVAEDAGVTKAFLDNLRAQAKVVLDTRDGAGAARGGIFDHYQEMNLLDGRILQEMRFLVGAFRDARTADPKLPALRSSLLQRSSGKRKPKEKAAQTPEKAQTPAKVKRARKG